MKVLEMCNLDYEIHCSSCKSHLLIEPSDWKYIKAQPDMSGCMEPPCIVCDCSVCENQIVLEESTKGKSGLYNALVSYIKNKKNRDSLL